MIIDMNEVLDELYVMNSSDQNLLLFVRCIMHLTENRIRTIARRTIKQNIKNKK